MKNINLAIIATFFSFFLTGQAVAFDLGKLTTTEGEVYHDVKVINADKHGLLFRHSGGACKLSFDDLSDSVREMFEPAEEVAAPNVGAKSLPTDKGGFDQAKQPIQQDYLLTIIVRRPQVVQRAHCAQQLSLRHPTSHNWPAHIHRFDRVHLLQNPYYRAQAKLNFLRFNGLLPVSCH